MAIGPLGAELQPAAVDVRSKNRRLIVHSPRRREAVDLVAAAVGEDWPVPAHETMKPAHLGDQLVSRPQGQVVGVPKDNRRTRAL